MSYYSCMNIFVDLDGTLFDTPRLGTDTAVLLQEKLGIDPMAYEAARQEMFGMNNRIYSAELHARRLAKRAHIDEHMLVRTFIDLFINEDSQKYVYEDSARFLTSVAELGSTAILTYGEAFVQAPRATKSGLRELVQDVIVTQHNKADTIVEYLEPQEVAGESVVLVDDSLEHLEAVKDKFPGSTTLHIVRSGSSASTRHQRVTSLDKALSLLKVKK